MELRTSTTRSLRATLSALGQWCLVAAACYFIVGAAAFPIWWKTFLLGGGLFEAAFWTEAFALLFAQVTSFGPLGAALLGFVLFLLIVLVFYLGRRSLASQDGRLLVPPRTTVILAALVPSALVFLSLFFVRGEYWTEAEMRRRWETLERKFAEPLFPRSVVPPTSGTFLYLDRETILDQYAVLFSAPALASDTSKVGAEQQVGVTAAVPGAGSLSAQRKATEEATITRMAPPLTAPLAASRLIEKFSRDPGTPDFTESYSAGFEFKNLLEGLAKRKVILTPEQRQQLEDAEIELFEQQMLHLTVRRAIFFTGAVSIVVQPGSRSPMLVAVVKAPLAGSFKGALKPQQLGPHLQHCVDDPSVDCTVESVRLFAVLESVTQTGPRERTARILPLALW